MLVCPGNSYGSPAPFNSIPASTATLKSVPAAVVNSLQSTYGGSSNSAPASYGGGNSNSFSNTNTAPSQSNYGGGSGSPTFSNTAPSAAPNFAQSNYGSGSTNTNTAPVPQQSGYGTSSNTAPRVNFDSAPNQSAILDDAFNSAPLDTGYGSPSKRSPKKVKNVVINLSKNPKNPFLRHKRS